MTSAHINAIGTSVPGHDVHRHFIAWAEAQLPDPRQRALFARMAARSGIDHRWSVIPPAPGGGSPIDPGGFYHGDLPGTAQRMDYYAVAAPELAIAAVDELRAKANLEGLTHLVVASCTGFVAPGIDQIVAARLGLPPTIERTLVGFMGCYAAIAALRVAHHIVRSEPKARVLTLCVELSSLHFPQKPDIESLLAGLQFGDGAAAALVTGAGPGFAIDRVFATTLDNSADLIGWTVGDHGFAMRLSGEVPGRIANALKDAEGRHALFGTADLSAIDSWAIHPGGRSILDAVETALDLPAAALATSRDILARFGNMSSATVLFVLEHLLADPRARRGIALAFGPGLAAEGFNFHRVPE